MVQEPSADGSEERVVGDQDVFVGGVGDFDPALRGGCEKGIEEVFSGSDRDGPVGGAVGDEGGDVR